MSSPSAAPAAAAAAGDPQPPQDMTYEFDCPQYKDFNAPEDEHADAWFGPTADEEPSSEVFDGSAETAIPTAMETEQEATAASATTETAAESKTEETEAAPEAAVTETQNEQPASSPSNKSRVQQLVESFETKAVAVAEPIVQQTIKPTLSRASSVVKEAVAAIEEASAAAAVTIPTAAVDTVTNIEIDAPIAAAEPVVQQEEAEEKPEQAAEESKAEEEAIIASITEVAAAEPEVDVVAETKEEQEDSLIAPTVDSPSFTAAAEEVIDEATSSRISQVFGSLRSSLPLLSAGCQTLMFKSEEFKATDEAAAALHEAFETVVSNSTPRIEAPDAAAVEEETEEVNESSESITLQLAAQFAEVADSPITARTAAAAAAPSSSAKRTASASPSRRLVTSSVSVHIDITATSSSSVSNGSVPSFLRPTAGSISRAQAIAEAAAAAQAAAGHITRRPVAVARAAAQASAASASSTPKLNKKRAASQDRLDELARPRSAAKASSNKKDEAESHRPSTASKAHRRPSISHAHSNHAAAAAAKLTVAQSPALVTRQRAKTNLKPAVPSTEEAELALIAAEKESVAATLRRNAAFFEKLTDPAVHHMSKEAQALPVRSAAAVTQPEEFSFHTAKRAKITTHAAADAQAAAAASSSAVKKESHTETPRMGEPTKPVPFSFQTALRASGARRETLVLSTEEQEIAALKSIKPFKATPLPESILAAPAPLPIPSAKKSFQPTQATSPQLMTKERSKRKQEEEASAAAAAPAVPAAASASVAQQSASKKPRREVQPFHLATEERGRRATEVFQSQREAEQAQERAAHNFHARPVGATAVAVPTAPIVAPIVPHCVELHREARAKFESKIHESEAAARAAREFHARPNPFTGAALAHDEALIVPAIKSDRPLTVPVTPALKSKQRHAKREEFEESMRAREAELKRLTDQRAEEEAERQAREISKQRASMKPAVTQLKPRILEGPTFVPQPSRAPLTQPESPMLITKRRGQAAMRRMSTVPQEDEENAAAQEDQENQIPEAADAAAAEPPMDEIAAKIAQPSEPVEGSLLGEMDSGLPLSAQFDAVAAE